MTINVHSFIHLIWALTAAVVVLLSPRFESVTVNRRRTLQRYLTIICQVILWNFMVLCLVFMITRWNALSFILLSLFFMIYEKICSNQNELVCRDLCLWMPLSFCCFKFCKSYGFNSTLSVRENSKLYPSPKYLNEWCGKMRRTAERLMACLFLHGYFFLLFLFVLSCVMSGFLNSYCCFIFITNQTSIVNIDVLPNAPYLYSCSWHTYIPWCPLDQQMWFMAIAL